MKKKYLVGLVFCIIIIVGIILTATIGLNLNLMYSNHKSIDIYLEKEFDNNDIYIIAKEVFGNEEVKVQKVELYEDIASIIVKDATDEQLEQLSSKINEKYQLTNEVSSIKVSQVMSVTDIPRVRLVDMAKQYVVYTGISAVLILVYFSIRFNKLGIAKTVVGSIIVTVLAEALYMAIIAITRYPIDKIAIIGAVAIYMLIMIFLNNNFLKQTAKAKAVAKK